MTRSDIAPISGDGADVALPPTAFRCAILVVSKHKSKVRASMREVNIICVDVAEDVFEVHGASTDAPYSARSQCSRSFPVSPPVSIEPDHGSNLPLCK